MKAVRGDIVGTLARGTSQDDIPEMLQSLLAERFGLKIHRETREHPEYALVAAKGGSKLKGPWTTRSILPLLWIRKRRTSG